MKELDKELQLSKEDREVKKYFLEMKQKNINQEIKIKPGLTASQKSIWLG